MAELVAKIAVSAAVYAIDRPYSYRIPKILFSSVIPGVRVTVPFGRGNKHVEGVVLSVIEEQDASKLKSIEKVLETTTLLTEAQLKLALWMRDRFFCTVYDAVHAMLPSGMWFKNGFRITGDKTISEAVLEISGEEAAEIAARKRLRAPQQAAVLSLLSSMGCASFQDVADFTGASSATVRALEKQGLLSIEHREVMRRPEFRTLPPSEPIKLNSEQEIAYSGLSGLLQKKRAEAALLFGVTGSGKTSVYIKLIEDIIGLGRSAIVLVPEISLTPQMLAVFSSYFGKDIAVLHSSLSSGERCDEWKRIKCGEAHVVIGTRSAVFAPVNNLGLIIIDEEQEHTYKSENSPRYHARDIAKYRCARDNAMLLLGSATPSLDSMFKAKSGQYGLFELKSRFNDRPLPSVIIADMTEELRSGNGSSISGILRSELEKNINRGEQSILFLNRRGTSALVVCGECGTTFDCPNCSVKLTFHASRRQLICHYCGHSLAVPECCGICGGKLKFTGAGTQQVEEDLKLIFPEEIVLRMDTDTVTASRSHETILREFEEKRIPFLVGTQMVAKGLDFENVTLVGVISADQLMYVGDYRAPERAFSLMTQVIGRSGRGAARGRAVIQTFTPKSELVRLAASQNYYSFYEREITVRRSAGSPPLSSLITVTVTGLEEERVIGGCSMIADSFIGYFADLAFMRVLGPAPAPLSRLMGRYRYRISLLGENSKRVRDTVSHVMRVFTADKKNRGLAVFADTDPHD